MAGRIIDILKFAFFVLLIPIVIAVTVGLIAEVQNQKAYVSMFFSWGIITYLILHLFVCELSDIYRYGHKITSDIFRFFEPLVEFGPYFVPIYTLLVLIVFYFVRLFFGPGWWDRYFIFFVSFSLVMHFVCAAQDMRARDINAVRPNYYFSMSLIYIANIFIVALFLDLILSGFLFPNFFSNVATVTRGIYGRVFGQLFGV